MRNIFSLSITVLLFTTIFLVSSVTAHSIIPQSESLCTKNSDCGETIDNFLCAGRYIIDKQIAPKCIASLGICANTVRTKAVYLCEGYCSGGECDSIGCRNNRDCNDHRASTTDICMNPGSTNSYCKHSGSENLISCKDNDDCGNSGFIGNNICAWNSVIADYRFYICQNPGTIFSFCTNTVTPQRLDICENTCRNGRCL
jgi:hypothetical protein